MNAANLHKRNTKLGMSGWEGCFPGHFVRDSNMTILPNSMHKPEFTQEDETHKILSDFEVLTNHPIPDRRPDQLLINKEISILSSTGFCLCSWAKSEKINKYLYFIRELKTIWNMQAIMA